MARYGRNSLSILQKFMRALGRDSKKGNAPSSENETFDWDWEERRNLYDRWESLYANSIYDEQADGGFREVILQDDIDETTDKKLHGFYNPVGCIVDAYQNVLRGQFGREIKVADKIGTATDEEPVNPNLLDPVTKLWRWSNLNNQKESLLTWCSLFGSVGLRVEAQVTDSTGTQIPVDRRRVRLRPVHPKEIVDFNEDADGNITDVLLEYSILGGGLGEDRDDDSTTIRETLTKKEFIRQVENKEPTRTPNALGVCPFVFLRHKDIGAQFGVPSHFGTEKILHQINWLLTRTSISVDRHVFAKWFAAASGAKPETFDLNDTTVAYVQMGPGDTAPKLEAIVAKLDFMGIERLLLFFIAHLRQRQPELVLSALEAMSGQSGQTIAKLLIPIEERILIARGHYEHALVRAMQIGMSWGILNGVWDLGSGSGTLQAAESAYWGGLEEFSFNERTALPETVFDKINRAKADVAPQVERANAARMVDGILPRKEQMRIAGVKADQIAGMMQQMRTQDVAMPDRTQM